MVGTAASVLDTSSYYLTINGLMDLLEHFRQLSRFDAWANREVVASFRRGGPPPAKSLALMAHIVAAEHLWLARIERRASPLAVWPELSLEKCEEQATAIANLWQRFLSGGTPLDQLVAYKNSKGEAYDSLVRAGRVARERLGFSDRTEPTTLRDLEPEEGTG